ncbi:TIGR02646 family protein [Janthinobacterium sp. OK676]|uniref:retron Ec78 anti-phage system effector HNH endonuclease PtuB n=1 Tax=Janthinobacterium sp. OK676 TaxID=1855295 RepID=UPI00089037FD|nr:retron Ec78 anti-phage system effector HNH endonuclease PtuB [Janthinobacterium sp. OK676]SDN23151.1 TIGR02646 family protein [Janthinobacterium sp. OK676]
MKKLNKSVVPDGLSNYILENPGNTWKQLKNNAREVYDEVKERLREDQHGLCAYCEIDLVKGNDLGLDDFRVEHFFPKSPHNPPPNRSLEWRNLLGVCTGGNAKGICIPERFSSPDHSCDVPKADHNWTTLILNPLVDIPSFPLIFNFDESTGEMAVETAVCSPNIIAKANESIHRLRLNSCARLLRNRKAVIDSLRDQVVASLEAGQDMDTLMNDLAKAHLPGKDDQSWPAFFTCLRWFFGPSADQLLIAMPYDG